MTILEVSDKKTEKEFIDLPRTLYAKDSNFIAPLDRDIKAVFDHSKNHLFAFGIAKRWIAVDDKGITIGRIAAFINREKANQTNTPTGGTGFFESINDEKVAFALFDQAKQWLSENGMQAMEGPVNFGENDKYWGLLIEGFVKPSMGMNYNPPYYQQFFEEYGFEKEYDQYTNVIDMKKPFPDRFNKIADWILSKPGYTFEHFKRSKFEKFASDFKEIYNDAWCDFENFTPIKDDSIRDSFRSMRSIVDEKIIWFAYYEGEPIAFILALPNINQILKPLKGKLTIFNKIRYLWLKKTTTIHRIRFIVMGCKKKYQNKGIESGLIRQLQIEVLPRNTIKEVELAWVGDFNTKMIAIHEATGAEREKVHRTYKYSW